MTVTCAADIVRLLEENGITATEEYFHDDAGYPYAVVLTPEIIIECPDMGGCMGCFFKHVSYRAELFTKSKDDPARERFIKIMIKHMPADTYRIEEASYGANAMYLTAVEFETEE